MLHHAHLLARRRLLLVALPLLLVVSSVPAALAAAPVNWRPSFPARVAAHLLADLRPGERVVVAPVGDATAALDTPAMLLSMVVGNLAAGVEVSTPKELGFETAKMDEGEVVLASNALRPTRLIALRLMRPGGALPALASVVGYRVSRSGELIQSASLVVTAGTEPSLDGAGDRRLHAPSGTQPPAPGLVAPPSGADPAELSDEARQVPGSEPLCSGLRIHHDPYARVEGDSAATERRSRSPGRFYLGEERSPLDADRLYRILERPDLAEAYQRRRTAKTQMYIGAGVAMAAGTGMMLGSLARLPAFNPEDRGREGSQDWAVVLGVGAGVVAIGSVILTAGLVMRTHPTSIAERRQLVDQHNARVSRGCRAAASCGPAEPISPGDAEVSAAAARLTGFGLMPGPGGVSVGLSGAF